MPQRAFSLNPTSKTIMRKLREVTKNRRRQQDRDKKSYSGFLHRTKPLYSDHGTKKAETESKSDARRTRPVAVLDNGPTTSPTTAAQAPTGRHGAPEAVERQFREVETMICELEADGNYAKVTSQIYKYCLLLVFAPVFRCFSVSCCFIVQPCVIASDTHRSNNPPNPDLR